MKGITLIGILLLVLGIGTFAFQGVSFTQEETVLDVGPVEAQVEQEKTIPLSPIAGGVLCVAGLGLLLYGRKGN